MTLYVKQTLYVDRKMELYLACLAQSVERKTLNLVVVGSSPTVGTILFLISPIVIVVLFLKLA